MKHRGPNRVEDKREVSPDQVELAWIEEVERRITRADRGEPAPVDFDEAMAIARRRIRCSRR